MKKFILLVFIVQCSLSVFAQEKQVRTFGKGIKFKPSEESSISFHYGSQIWVRYMQMNDGTVDSNNKPVQETWDVGLRRTRLSMYASLWNDQVIVYSQLGMNSQNFSSGTKPQIYFHDAWTGFNLVKEKLMIGAGLHGWHGISRLSSISYVKGLMIDHPGFNLANLGRTDQAGRQLGVFAKGNVGRFNYRVSVDKTFLPSKETTVAFEQSGYVLNDKSSVRGYAFFSVFDTEVFKSPYASMSYLGKKKILNIGAGFDFHTDLMGSLDKDGELLLHDKKLFGADVFLDYPLANQSAFTLYTVAYLFDFGPNYIRKYGVMNPYKVSDNPQGGGISHYNVGTGNIYYAMAGYLLPKQAQPFRGRLQAVAAVHYKDFDYLNEVAVQYDAGVNYYIAGHNSKIGIQYSNWPVYGSGDAGSDVTRIDNRKSSVTVQFHIYM